MRPIDWAAEADRHFRTNEDAHTTEDFNLHASRIFYIDGSGKILTHMFSENVYDGLENLQLNPKADCKLIGIETCGWAAPLPTDGDVSTNPSEHPQRRRVRMVAVVDKEFNHASYLVFEDDIKNPLTDEDGTATGKLADELVNAMVHSNIYSILHRVT